MASRPHRAPLPPIKIDAFVERALRAFGIDRRAALRLSHPLAERYALCANTAN